MADRRPSEDARALALALLGLPLDASRRDIVGAYRSLARATHPDRCADADASDRFAAVVDAYHQALQEEDPPPVRSSIPVRPARVVRSPLHPPGVGADVPLRAGPVHVTPYPNPPDDRRG